MTVAQKIGFIGAGSIASAIMKGAIGSGFAEASRIRAINKSNEERMARLERELGITKAQSLEELVSTCTALVLAVKPGDVPGVLEELVKVCPADGHRVVISVAAGVPIQYLEETLGPHFTVLRSMPNTPTQVGEGVTAISAGSGVTGAEKALAEGLLSSIGEVYWVGEEQLDSVTALSGSGPAYFFKLAEGMASAGARMGLDKGLSERLARQTLAGAGRLLKESPLGLTELVAQVASPNGTTAAALKVFEGRQLGLVVEEAMVHAAARSREMAQTPGRHSLTKVKRLVVKIGSSTVTDPAGGLHTSVLADVARQIASLRFAGKEVVLVSSGAVAAGRGKIGSGPQDSITERQILSSVGQALLMTAYDSLFGQHGVAVAQVLLTRDDFTNPRRAAICKNTLTELCARGIVPIVNENDAVSFDEIELGDNDSLSARVAVLIEAGALVILTDTEGFYDADPRMMPHAKLQRTVARIDSSITAMANSAGTTKGTGGMVTKLWAVKLAMENGIPSIIANGSKTDVLLSAVGGKEIGTFFPAEDDRTAGTREEVVS